MKHHVLIENPPVDTLAAGVLLSRRLHKNEVKDWLDFREKFLKKRLAESGELRCEYCQKGGLLIDVGENPSRGELAGLATIDHVVPLSKGGEEKNEKNLKVACYPCNQRKADSEKWGHSSVGRAAGSQSAGQGFDSPCLHQNSENFCGV